MQSRPAAPPWGRKAWISSLTRPQASPQHRLSPGAYTGRVGPRVTTDREADNPPGGDTGHEGQASDGKQVSLCRKAGCWRSASQGITSLHFVVKLDQRWGLAGLGRDLGASAEENQVPAPGTHQSPTPGNPFSPWPRDSGAKAQTPPETCLPAPGVPHANGRLWGRWAHIHTHLLCAFRCLPLQLGDLKLTLSLSFFTCKMALTTAHILQAVLRTT